MAIPWHFEQRFASPKADISELTADETESSVHSMLEKHGAPAVVSCLVVNPNEMKQEIGYRLMDELGDLQKSECWEIPPVLVEENGLHPVIEAVGTAISEISAAEATLDDGQIDAAVERFLSVISDYRARLRDLCPHRCAGSDRRHHGDPKAHMGRAGPIPDAGDRQRADRHISIP